MFNNLLEFEHKEYTVVLTKTEISECLQECLIWLQPMLIPVSIVDDSVIKQMKPCSLKVVRH